MNMFDNENYDNETSSEQLRQVLEHTQESMREAVMNGQGEKIYELDNQARSLSGRIFSATVAETKRGIDDAEAVKVDSQRRLELLRDFKKVRNLQAGRAENLFLARMAKVQEAEMAIQMEQSRYQQTLVSRRELKARLQALLKAKQDEQEKQYEQYRY
jgi:hypothetical protein